MQRFIEHIFPSNKIKNESNSIPMKINVNQIRKIMKKTVLDYLSTIKKRTEVTNNLAKKQKLPYRLNVYTNNTKVFLDVIIIDEKEREQSRITHDITNNDFNKLIENISCGSGLIIDDLPH